MKPTTIIFAFAVITCFSFSKPNESLKPGITTLEPKKINHIDSMPVFKMTSTGIIASRKVMIPKPVITSDLSVTKFDAATTYIKGRGTMIVEYPKNLIPFKPIEIGGSYAPSYKSIVVPEILWYLSFPEKKRFLLTFKLQVPQGQSPPGSILFLTISHSDHYATTELKSFTLDRTFTAILDLTDAPGDYVIRLKVGSNFVRWFFSSLLIEEIN